MCSFFSCGTLWVIISDTPNFRSYGGCGRRKNSNRCYSISAHGWHLRELSGQSLAEPVIPNPNPWWTFDRKHALDPWDLWVCRKYVRPELSRFQSGHAPPNTVSRHDLPSTDPVTATLGSLQHDFPAETGEMSTAWAPLGFGHGPWPWNLISLPWHCDPTRNPLRNRAIAQQGALPVLPWFQHVSTLTSRHPLMISFTPERAAEAGQRAKGPKGTCCGAGLVSVVERLLQSKTWTWNAGNVGHVGHIKVLLKAYQNFQLPLEIAPNVSHLWLFRQSQGSRLWHHWRWLL